jgi:diguanylate cyclase (GGDEF)-like protein
MMLQITAVMLVVDVLSRFDGNPDSIFPVINRVGNFLIFILSPVLPSIWLLYVHFQIYDSKKKTKKLLYPMLAIFTANAFLLILSGKYGWFYSIDSDNIYHRGPLFLFTASITVVLLIAVFIIIVANRHKIDKKHFYPLLFFAFPPFFSIILQIAYYGMSLMLNSVVLSILILFLYIQNRSLNIDYLTGVFNRKKLDEYLKGKVGARTGNKTFSAILIDLDNFKAINDSFGHDIGDEALEVSVNLLRSCLRADDIIARYGGDEFYAVLNISDRNVLETTVERIRRRFVEYDKSSTKPYKISISMGYDLYSGSGCMRLDEFQKHLDKLMYENKRINKELSREE